MPPPSFPRIINTEACAPSIYMLPSSEMQPLSLICSRVTGAMELMSLWCNEVNTVWMELSDFPPLSF